MHYQYGAKMLTEVKMSSLVLVWNLPQNILSVDKVWSARCSWRMVTATFKFYTFTLFWNIYLQGNCPVHRRKSSLKNPLGTACNKIELHILLKNKRKKICHLKMLTKKDTLFSGYIAIILSSLYLLQRFWQQSKYLHFGRALWWAVKMGIYCGYFLFL